MPGNGDVTEPAVRECRTVRVCAASGQRACREWSSC